jgi:2-polyprenyl-6-methoxyphenol hydroxylase-like FAD-dependent oxidoreductase
VICPFQLEGASRMSGLLGQRAVVVGAGIGGLSAAGALAGYFEQVDVLERDRLTGSAASRSRTPQDRHPQGLLVSGLKALGEIFPGFERDLARAGAVPRENRTRQAIRAVGCGALPARDLASTILCASRPLIEFVLRCRAEAIANIAVLPECRATEVMPATPGAAVRGVRF